MRKTTSQSEKQGKLKLGKSMIIRLNEANKELIKGGLMRAAFTKQSVCMEQCCNSNDSYCNTTGH